MYDVGYKSTFVSPKYKLANCLNLGKVLEEVNFYLSKLKVPRELSLFKAHESGALLCRARRLSVLLDVWQHACWQPLWDPLLLPHFQTFLVLWLKGIWQQWLPCCSPPALPPQPPTPCPHCSGAAADGETGSKKGTTDICQHLNACAQNTTSPNLTEGMLSRMDKNIRVTLFTAVLSVTAKNINRTLVTEQYLCVMGYSAVIKTNRREGEG